MPSGKDPAAALSAFTEWCESQSLKPIIFGCEAPDRGALKDWALTEIGRQPLFIAGPSYSPRRSGPDQPLQNRELRRQARRALSKKLEVSEIGVASLWEFAQSGSLDDMLYYCWKRRGLADFGFLVEFNISMGLNKRRTFVVRKPNGETCGICFLVPSDRGWLLEHQLLTPDAPNGTGELLMCSLLFRYLQPGERLSLGVTPLFSELTKEAANPSAPEILSFVPAPLRDRVLSLWEPLYGFRSLLNFRQKLEPMEWESVYWVVPKRRTLQDILAVLGAFAGGSFVRFGLDTLEKHMQVLGRRLAPRVLPALNRFYIATLALWIPILWNLDGVQLFGNPLACKVWALYDVLLVVLFLFHQRVVKKLYPSLLTKLLLGLVVADTVLAWLQTGLYHGGFPTSQPLGTLIFLINTAPVSAFCYLVLVDFAVKPLPFMRREQGRP